MKTNICFFLRQKYSTHFLTVISGEINISQSIIVHLYFSKKIVQGCRFNSVQDSVKIVQMVGGLFLILFNLNILPRPEGCNLFIRNIYFFKQGGRRPH